jgi:hypothetical protein
MEKHSEKGLNTITRMNTVPADWAFVEIVWKEELRTVPTKCTCPHCSGTGKGWANWEGAKSYAEAKKITGKEMNALAIANGCNGSSFYEVQKYANQNGWRRSGCEKCGQTGRMMLPKERMVMVGYPQWHEATLFDSRFRNFGCELCGKQVFKSNLYPVTARGADGRIHGMWVGMDCAKKFLGIKNFKKMTENEMLEVK